VQEALHLRALPNHFGDPARTGTRLMFAMHARSKTPQALGQPKQLRVPMDFLFQGRESNLLHPLVTCRYT
jgi:hypothetical protein